MRTAGLEPVISHYPQSWRGGRRCHILPEQQGPSKRMAAKRTPHGLLDATEWDDPAGLNSHEELHGGGPGKVTGQYESGCVRARKAADLRWNVELGEAIRFATLNSPFLAIDLDSNPQAHCECSHTFQLIQRKNIHGACPSLHIRCSTNHSSYDNA